MRVWHGLGLWRVVALACFGYLLYRPVSTNNVLIPVLGTLGLIAAGSVWIRGRRIAAPLLPALFCTFLFGLGWLALGANNPGFYGAALVFVAAPLLYWTATVAVDELTLRALLYTAAAVTVLLGATITLYVAGNLGLIPRVLPASLLEETGARYGGQSGGYTAIAFYGISTLVAAGPMWIASLLVSQDALLPPPWLRIAAAVSAIAAGLVAGRRALIVAIILAPLVAWLVKRVLVRKQAAGRANPTVIVGALAALGVATLYAPSLFSGGIISSTWNSLSNYFTPGSSSLASAEDKIRAEQSDRLLSAWGEEPIFGHGFGAVIQGYARSLEPWRFELQYHALLFQTGLLGALVVLAGAAITAAAVIRAARVRPDLAPTLVVACAAALAMLVGNATNPYLQAPGHMWAIFLPIAVANVILLSTRPERADDPTTAAAPARSSR